MSVCPECGSNIYFAEHFPRVRDENFRLKAEIERQAAEHAVEKARWKVEEISREEERTFRGLRPNANRSKVERQTAVIRRLEQRLRDAGLMPYAEEKS